MQQETLLKIKQAKIDIAEHKIFFYSAPDDIDLLKNGIKSWKSFKKAFDFNLSIEVRIITGENKGKIFFVSQKSDSTPVMDGLETVEIVINPFRPNETNLQSLEVEKFSFFVFEEGKQDFNPLTDFPECYENCTISYFDRKPILLDSPIA